MLARVHGQLCTEICRCRCAPGGRMLWDHPDHIRVMKSALRASEARSKVSRAQVKEESAVTAAPALPLAQRSRVGAKIAAREFVTMVEIVPPKGTDIGKEIEGARF